MKRPGVTFPVILSLSIFLRLMRVQVLSGSVYLTSHSVVS